MFALSPAGSAALVLESEALGRGGEGAVYGVKSLKLTGLPPASELVAKIYHAPEEEQRKSKLKAMVEAPVKSPSVAWPQALIFNAAGEFQGYLMKRLPSQSYKEWLYLSNAKDRRSLAPSFDLRYAYGAIRNLAAAMLSVHAAGHRIGDVNESNIFVGDDATVLLVDTDSMQIAGCSEEPYRCLVGKPEYTAPELMGGSLREKLRTKETDLFAFAVAAYQMLTGGSTPHMGVFDPDNPDDPPSTATRIQQGLLPNLKPAEAASFGLLPKPTAPTSALPEKLKAFLIALLEPNPGLRTADDSLSLAALIAYLDSLADELKQCSRVEAHWFEGSACGWCAAAAVSGSDPWSMPSEDFQQKALPALTFGAPAPSKPKSTPPRGSLGGYPFAAPTSPPATLNPYNTAPPGSLGLPPSQPQQKTSQAKPPLNPYNSKPQARPEFIKGKLVVDYADGSWGVRPPLGRLLRSNPKVAAEAIRVETPSFLRAWWSTKQDLASPLGLLLGAGVAAAVALSWFGVLWLAFYTLSFMMPLSAELVTTLAATFASTSVLGSGSLMISALRDRARTKKTHKDLSKFPLEAAWKTPLRFLSVAVFYGPPLVVGVTLALLLNLLFGGGSSSPRRR